MNILPLNPLLLLPEEILRNDIFNHLNIANIFNFSSCSSYFQKLVTSNWRLMAHLKYPYIKNMEKKIEGGYEINYEQLAKRLFLLTRYVELIKQEKIDLCRNGAFVIKEERKKVNQRIYFDILIDTLKGNDEEILKSLEKRKYFHSSVRDFLNTVCYLHEENELLKYLDFVYSIKIRRENALKEDTKPTASSMEMAEWKLRYEPKEFTTFHRR